MHCCANICKLRGEQIIFQMITLGFENAWSIHGLSQEYPWIIPGVVLKNPWIILGVFLELPWSIPAVSLDYPQNIDGSSPECLWSIHSILRKTLKSCQKSFVILTWTVPLLKYQLKPLIVKTIISTTTITFNM